MKKVLNLTLHEISKAVWKASLYFFIVPMIGWYLLLEHNYKWYDHLIVVISIFILTMFIYMNCQGKNQ